MTHNAETARALLAAGGPAALATLGPGSAPFCSFVLIAPAADLSPILLISRLARHSRNLEADARASLLIAAQPLPGEDHLATARLSLTGTAEPDADPVLREAYLARHPDAAAFSGLGDFHIYRFQITDGHLVAGFGRIETLQASAFVGGDSPDLRKAR